MVSGKRTKKTKQPTTAPTPAHTSRSRPVDVPHRQRPIRARRQVVAIRQRREEVQQHALLRRPEVQHGCGARALKERCQGVSAHARLAVEIRIARPEHAHGAQHARCSTATLLNRFD